MSQGSLVNEVAVLELVPGPIVVHQDQPENGQGQQEAAERKPAIQSVRLEEAFFRDRHVQPANPAHRPAIRSRTTP